MSVILLLIPLSIVIAACFLGAFIWAVRSGQYEDTLTPSMRVLLEEPCAPPSRSADLQSAVSPTCSRQALDNSSVLEKSGALQVANLRYSRLQVCATSVATPSPPKNC
jgi:cbb3-type cytochrome oxidase maturation protein